MKILKYFIVGGFIVALASYSLPDNGKKVVELDLGTKGRIER